MYTLIEYPIGIITEAVVLSMEQKRLRVAAAGFSDVLELTQVGHEWVTEQGQRIEVGFLQFALREATPVFPPGVALAARAAATKQSER